MGHDVMGTEASPESWRERVRSYHMAPRVVTWEVTRACELRCVHCRAEAIRERNPLELTTVEGLRLLDSISLFGEPAPVVVLSGGDPMLRPDVPVLIRRAVDLALPVAVIPAPSRSLDRRTVLTLQRLGVRRIALSIDGASAPTHDAFRGESGSFLAAIRAARAAADVGLPFQVNTTVTEETAQELPAIADLLETLGAVAWEVFFLVPVGRGSSLRPLNAIETERWLRWLYRRQRGAPFRVMTVEAPQYRRVADQIERRDTGEGRVVGTTSDGFGFIFVGHTGEVHPSGFLPLSVGNVRNASLVDLYRHSPVLQRLRRRDELGGKCGACSYRDFCGGSRARAWAVSGNPMAEDPFCAYRPPRARRPA